MSLSLFACGSDNKDIIDKINEIKSRPSRPIPKLPMVKSKNETHVLETSSSFKQKMDEASLNSLNHKLTASTLPRTMMKMSSLNLAYYMIRGSARWATKVFRRV